MKNSVLLLHDTGNKFQYKSHCQTGEQNCTNRCEDHCICKVPNKCSEDETKCGEAPPENHPDCPPDEICVPSECNCK